MKISTEISLSEFDFWSGAEDNAKKLSEEQFESVEDVLDETLVNPTDTEINDLFWFEFDTILEWTGLCACADCGEVFDEMELEWNEGYTKQLCTGCRKLGVCRD